MTPSLLKFLCSFQLNNIKLPQENCLQNATSQQLHGGLSIIYLLTPTIDQNTLSLSLVHHWRRFQLRSEERNVGAGRRLTLKTDRFSMTAEIMQISNLTSEIGEDRPQ